MCYSIGEVSEKLNIPASTLRYYDKHGLLPFVDRNENGQRSFKDNDLNFLEVISCMKKCGMSIKEIRHFIELCMQGDVTLNARYDLLEQEEASVVKQIDVLQKQLDFLHYKMWYFKTAIDAGTEDIHMVSSIDGKRVTPEIHEQYQEALKHCHDINELIRIQKQATNKKKEMY